MDEIIISSEPAQDMLETDMGVADVPPAPPLPAELTELLTEIDTSVDVIPETEDFEVVISSEVPDVQETDGIIPQYTTEYLNYTPYLEKMLSQLMEIHDVIVPEVVELETELVTESETDIVLETESEPETEMETEDPVLSRLDMIITQQKSIHRDNLIVGTVAVTGVGMCFAALLVLIVSRYLHV